MLTCPHCGFSPLPKQARQCSQCGRSLSDGQPTNRPREATHVESVNELHRAAKPVRTPTLVEPSPKSKANVAPVKKVQPFQPIRRPSMALVCVIDDGRDTGEWFRIRASRTVIGRSGADIVIPHDESVSSQHLELVRTGALGNERWQLRDLKSTNGAFVRVSTATLKDNQEILLGSHRFRFSFAPTSSVQTNSSPELQRTTTQSAGCESQNDRRWIRGID